MLHRRAYNAIAQTHEQVCAADNCHLVLDATTEPSSLLMHLQAADKSFTAGDLLGVQLLLLVLLLAVQYEIKSSHSIHGLLSAHEVLSSTGTAGSVQS